MSTDKILGLLLAERDKLTAAIEALQGPTATEKTPGPGRKVVLPSVEQDSKPEATVGPTAPVKRKMSAAGRRAIIAGAKKRSAAIKAAKAAAAAQVPVAAVLAAMPKAAPAKAPVAAKKGTLTEAGRKALSIAMKKRWAAKKKAAAKRKAA
jgi:colicin import membrane protein